MDEIEVKKINRKIDFRILPILFWLYLLSCLDRTNIGNVKSYLLDDLNLTEEQYSTAVSVFYIGYILCEIPSNMILKKTRPSFWIGFIVFCWGISSACMFFITTYSSLIITRVFLGITESGFFPGVIFYLTFWYPKKEQGLRVALFFSASPLAGAIGGILAYGILQIDTLFGYPGWRWLFLFEGVPSVLSGLITIFLLPNYPSTSSWLTKEEQDFVQNRIANEAAKGKIASVAGNVIGTFKNWKVWGFAFMFLMFVTPSYSISFYLPAIIEDLGFSSLESNIMTSPVHLVSMICVIINAYYSDKKADRSLHVIIPSCVGCVGFILLTVATYFDYPKLSYLSMFFASAGIASGIPIVMAWMTNCLNDWVTVATASGLVVGVGNLGGVIGPTLYGNLYIPGENGEDGSYILGHLCMAVATILSVVISLILKKFAKPLQQIQDERSPLLKEVN